MIPKKINRILLAPLDWGLGHAARCIPIIRELRLLGCEVVLAAEGAIAELMMKEFPDLEIKQLRGYNITYAAGTSLFASIFFQLPGLFMRIKKEHQWLKETLQREYFDCIISDNRPGFWSKQTHNIYITHQLFIYSGKSKWLNRRLQSLHAHYMKNFNSVWVPDLEEVKNLAGELSHPLKQIVKPTYIGLLSRFERDETEVEKNDLLVLLSGPEPQRSLLEEKLIFQLKEYHGTVVFVRGLPQNNSTALNLSLNIKVYDHLPANELQKAIASSKLILCRSGYTTLMDLMKLHKKALLIPTPGQPEQEYLATYMQAHSYFPFVQQKDFLLPDALQQAATFCYENPFTKNDFEMFKPELKKFVSTIAQ